MATRENGELRWRHRTLGGHVHVDVFGPGQGGCGSLTFRVDEWPHVLALLEGRVKFIGEELTDDGRVMRALGFERVEHTDGWPDATQVIR